MVASDWLVSFRSNRYSVPLRLIGKTVEVQARDGVVRIFHRGACVAEHRQRTGRHELAIAPEHGPGTIMRNARLRYADGPKWLPDPRQLDVEVRDLALYERLAGGLVEVRP